MALLEARSLNPFHAVSLCSRPGGASAADAAVADQPRVVPATGCRKGNCDGTTDEHFAEAVTRATGVLAGQQEPGEQAYLQSVAGSAHSVPKHFSERFSQVLLSRVLLPLTVLEKQQLNGASSFRGTAPC